MSNRSNRSNEHDIAFAALKYLATVPSKSAVTSNVKRNVPNHIALTQGDLEPSETRPNEQLWQQVVGNIVCHRIESADNFINRGLIGYGNGVWTLTDAGNNYLKKRNA